MPSFLSNLPLQATAPILTSSFVAVSADFGCAPATAGQFSIAISQVGFDRPPGLINLYPGAAASYTDVAAASGEELQLFFLGDVAPVRLSTAGSGCVAGQFLQPDVTSQAIATTSSNQYFAAVALQGGNAGEIITCLVGFGKV